MLGNNLHSVAEKNTVFGLSNIFKPKPLGEWGEDYIADLYQRKGYRILDKNYFNHQGKRVGEIDVIAVKDKNLVFVEVKTRTNLQYGTPAEAVTIWKQQRLIKACKTFLNYNPKFADYNYRIDVAELQTDLDRKRKSVRIIENAVEDRY